MEKLLKSLKLCGKFLLAKSKWLHPLLPDKFKADLSIWRGSILSLGKQILSRFFALALGVLLCSTQGKR
jgi:hypothetical protein